MKSGTIMSSTLTINPLKNYISSLQVPIPTVASRTFSVPKSNDLTVNTASLATPNLIGSFPAVDYFAADERNLESLKAATRNGNDPATLRQVSAEFESLFINILLQNMRSVSLSAEERSQDMDTYMSLFDQQMASVLSKNGGIGLGEMIAKQLSNQMNWSGQKDLSPSTRNLSVITRNSLRNAFRTPKSDIFSLLEAYNVENQRGIYRYYYGGYENKSNAQFTQEMLNQAIPAAMALGVSPHLIVAHAALESGWGKNYIKTANGANSHNLFGIKATPNWKGSTATVWTTEFRNGIPRREKATFRAYPSYAHAFADYAQLLMNNERYKDALNRGNDATAFARALAKGGYATDPMYAQKLSALARSNKFQKVGYK